MCGEHAHVSHWSRSHVGSSPHVRGAQSADEVEVELRGIIPACAGSTYGCKHQLGPRRDHPRMCGEHFGHVFRVERP